MMDEFDTVIDECLDELKTLLAAGLSSDRGGQEYSTEEQFIRLSRRVWELATARPDTKPTKRPDEKRLISERERVFARVKPRHDEEKAKRERRA